MLRYEEKEKRRKRHKSASTKSHKDSDSSDTETAPSSRSQTPGRSGLVACAGFFVVGGGGTQGEMVKKVLPLFIL